MTEERFGSETANQMKAERYQVKQHVRLAAGSDPSWLPHRKRWLNRAPGKAGNWRAWQRSNKPRGRPRSLGYLGLHLRLRRTYP
jgi:hypothetical protein